MSAPRAARIILAGAEANRSRVLVGRDARGVDLLVRLAPRRYNRLLMYWAKRTWPVVRFNRTARPTGKCLTTRAVR
jgi:hypothetical protein